MKTAQATKCAVELEEMLVGYDLYRSGIMDEPRLLDVPKPFIALSSLGGVERVAELINQAHRGMEDRGLYFRFNLGHWPRVLKLAYDHGWQPKHGPDYYIDNDGNKVDSEEARNLANALEAALNFSKEVNGKGISTLDEDLKALTHAWLQDKLVRFIRFCRGGEFEIH